jgi:hypothetical protein
MPMVISWPDNPLHSQTDDNEDNYDNDVTAAAAAAAGGGENYITAPTKMIRILCYY